MDDERVGALRIEATPIDMMMVFAKEIATVAWVMQTVADYPSGNTAGASFVSSAAEVLFSLMDIIGDRDEEAVDGIVNEARKDFVARIRAAFPDTREIPVEDVDRAKEEAEAENRALRARMALMRAMAAGDGGTPVA